MLLFCYIAKKQMKHLIKISLFALLCLTSCTSNMEQITLLPENGVNDNTISEALRISLEEEQVTYKGEKVLKNLFGMEVMVARLSDSTYALGDMIFSESNFNATKKKKTANKGVLDRRVNRWPNNTILYKYDNAMPQITKNHVDFAATYITNNTNLTVRKWNSSDTGGFITVNYDDDNGCSAQVGYLNNNTSGQEMNLTVRCTQGAAIHEFLHAAGVVHEQTHWNRDSYITVMINNIRPDARHLYNKLPDADGWEYSHSVDTESIMMYGSYYNLTDAAKANGWRSMKRIDGTTIVPQRTIMTAGDIGVINGNYY